MRLEILLILGLIVYLIWAVQHHHRDKSLTWEVMVEYLAIAGLLAIILFGTIL